MGSSQIIQEDQIQYLPFKKQPRNYRLFSVKPIPGMILEQVAR